MERIADRANELTGSVSHGHACYMACREAGIPEAEVPSTASIVSAMLINRELNPHESEESRLAYVARKQAQAQAGFDGHCRDFASYLINEELPGKENRGARGEKVAAMCADASYRTRQLPHFVKKFADTYCLNVQIHGESAEKTIAALK